MRANNGPFMTPILIVTRPVNQGASFAADIAKEWQRPLTVLQSPLLEIVPVPTGVPDFDEAIFTSVNGVAAAAEMGLRRGMRAWCVGDRTAQAAAKAGFVPVTGPGNADSLVQVLLSVRPAGILAHIRGRHARGDICHRLNAAGLSCLDVVAYDQRALDLSLAAKSAVNGSDPVVFPLFSPRTSTILNTQGPFAAPVYVVAISHAVADTLDQGLALRCVVAASMDVKGMQQAVLAMLGDIAANPL